MKTVFNTDEIAHLWRHQTQDNARNSGSNFYFQGRSIYSYGSHFEIARLVTKPDGSTLVLFTPRSYSNTTSKHISIVRQSLLPTDERLYVMNFNASTAPAPAIPDWRKHKMSGYYALPNTRKEYVEKLRQRYSEYLLPDGVEQRIQHDLTDLLGPVKNPFGERPKRSYASVLEQQKKVEVQVNFNQWAAPHEENLRYLLAELDGYVQKMKRSRSVDYVALARGLAANADKYLAHFPDAVQVFDTAWEAQVQYGHEGGPETIGERLERARTWSNSPEDQAAFKARELAAAEREAARVEQHRINTERQQAARKKELKQKYQEFSAPGGPLAQWLSGALTQVSYGQQELLELDAGIRLHLIEDGVGGHVVHTSRGARVPSEDARKLLRLVRLVKLAGKGDRPVGITVGHYHVNSITAEGNLIAGCHVIQNKEIERFAKSVGWSEAHDEDHQLREVRELLS